MKLHYKKMGEGQPLMILHGLFGSSDNWQTLGRKLAEEFTVYLVDQRNHGHSPHSEEFSYELMANDIGELVDAEKLEDLLLVGHSMGGKTAMTYAQHHPGTIEKLVVVDIGPKEYPMHHEHILEGLQSIDVATVKSRGEATKLLANHVPEAAVQQFLLKNLYWKEKGQLGWRINIPVLSREIGQIIGGIGPEKVLVPTLFVRGGRSQYVLESDYTDIVSQFPNATIKTIEEAGHWVHAEAPEQFMQLLTDFARGSLII